MKRRVNCRDSIIAACFRACIRLRYKVQMESVGLLDDPRPKLFLPNHPALIDPIILCSFVYKHNNIAPAISAKYYRNKMFRPLLKIINAIPVADLSEGERDYNVYEKLANGVKKELQRGNYALIYPGGQLANGPEEKLANKQGAFRLVAEMPEDVRIVAVRISGLWGSRWSRAATGKTPDFLKVLRNSLAYLLKRGIFFCPKRRVKFEFCDFTDDLKRLSQTDRRSFNAFLEAYYNNI